MPGSRRTIRRQEQAVIGIDLGATKLVSALFSGEGRPLAKRTVALEQRQGGAVSELVLREISRLMRCAVKRELSVHGIGVCVPGVAHAKTGCVWAPNIPGWEDYPLRAEIRAALADPGVKVVIESDRAASILGEVWKGSARGCRNVVFLAVGTGIGAGVLVNGRVLRGAHDIAGAVGWLALDRPFKPEYIQRGCFESHASGAGIAKVAKAAVARRATYRGPLRTKHDISAHDVFAADEQADAVAEEVLAEAIEFWGMASANLISLFNPEMLIFGGGVFGPATRFLQSIAAEARRWAQPIAFQHVRFEASQLGGDAALHGAAYVALRRARVPLS